MKKIQYSPVLMQNPLRQNDPPKAYAVLQTSGKVTTDELIEHVTSHGCNFSEGTIKGIITDLVNHIQEFLVQGYIVELEPLGKFYPGMSSRGASTVENFTDENIKTFRGNFRPCDKLTPATLLSKAQFEKTVSKKAVEAVKRQLADGTLVWADTENGDPNSVQDDILVSATPVDDGD